MEPFCFNLEEESGDVDYRFRGSYIFDKEGTPWWVDGAEEGTLLLQHDGDTLSVSTEDAYSYLFGVPEHGWVRVPGGPGCLYIPAGFPERKWKYGYQPDLDTACSMTPARMRALMRPISSTEQGRFLAGNGVFSRKIAAKESVVYCHDQIVGVVKDGGLSILTKYDFLLYEFPEDYEVSVNDNI